MSTSPLKGVIIASVIFFIVCFTFMRINSIPFEEELILDVIIFVFVILNLVVWKILDARKAKKKEE
ncbi:MAG: hypothetical protein A2Y13_07295 [Planctomycetes bacterium GWC2_45_44]|nr:MAG: hypothetical protein A2Y13_07295 [Planctomycetes bacterium GWC2_45_44]